MWIYVVIAVIIIIVIYAIVLFNSFSSLDNKVKEAFSTMDIYLKKRWDLVPNLVEVVKSYAKHEKDTLEEITKLRGNTYDNMSNDEKIKTNVKLNRDIDKIMLLVEAYPELKASNNFKDTVFYINLYKLKHISTSEIIYKAYKDEIISLKKAKSL